MRSNMSPAVYGSVGLSSKITRIDCFKLSAPVLFLEGCIGFLLPTLSYFWWHDLHKKKKTSFDLWCSLMISKTLLRSWMWYFPSSDLYFARTDSMMSFLEDPCLWAASSSLTSLLQCWHVECNSFFFGFVTLATSFLTLGPMILQNSSNEHIISAMR